MWKDTGELRIDAGILSPCLGPLMTNHLLDASYGYLSLMAKSASALSGRRNRIEAWHQQSSHMYLTTRHEQTQRLQTHSKKRQKKLIFMSEQSSTDYNEHGMKPKLPGQTILLLLLILYQVLEAALAMLYCLLLALPHAAVPNGHEEERQKKRAREVMSCKGRLQKPKLHRSGTNKLQPLQTLLQQKRQAPL